MARTLGSINYYKYRVRTVSATIPDKELASILEEEAKDRFNLHSTYLQIGVGLRLILVKKTR